VEEYSWGFSLVAKGGQNVKENEKKGRIEIKNKEPEHSLKVKIKANADSVDQVLKEIIEEIGSLDEVSFTIEGTEKQLQGQIKKIAKIIADAGGQQSLDIHLGEEKIKA
jgi:2C-methyl-D-erythritol 2,4-cyclodiphosphate synthase